MRLLLSLLALFLVACQQSAPTSTPSPTPLPTVAATPRPLEELQLKPGDLHSYASRLEGRHAAAFYINQVKAGYVIHQMKRVPTPLEVAPSAPGEKWLLEEQVETRLRMEILGEVAEQEETSRSYFSLQGLGPMVYSRSRSQENGKSEELVVKKKGQRHQVWADGKLQRDVPLSRMSLAQSLALEDWLTAPVRQSGDRTESFEPDWRQDPVDSRSEVVYRGRGQALWRNQLLDVFRVEMLIQGLRLEGEVTAHLLPLKASVAGMMEVRLEEEKQARTLEATASWNDWGLPVQGKIEKPQEATLVRLLARSQEPLNLPQNGRQKVRALPEGWSIELQRELLPPLPEPLDDGSRRAHLRVDFTTRSNAAMLAQAWRLTHRSETTQEKARALLEWVHHEVEAASVSQASTAEMVFRDRRGDCTEYSLLFVALCKAVGIPARLAQGAMYVDGLVPFFGWHQWAEFHDGQGWIGVDPAWNQFGVDATHVLFDHDPKDLSSFNQIGRLRLEVVEVLEHAGL